VSARAGACDGAGLVGVVRVFARVEVRVSDLEASRRF